MRKRIARESNNAIPMCTALPKPRFVQRRHVGRLPCPSVLPEDEARLSPLGQEHINVLGRYSFVVPESVARGELRPLRNPADGDR